MVSVSFSVPIVLIIISLFIVVSKYFKFGLKGFELLSVKQNKFILAIYTMIRSPKQIISIISINGRKVLYLLDNYLASVAGCCHVPLSTSVL